MLSLFLKQIPLSDVAGLVARGEAIGGEEAERLEAERAAARHAGTAPAREPRRATTAAYSLRGEPSHDVGHPPGAPQSVGGAAPLLRAGQAGPVPTQRR